MSTRALTLHLLLVSAVLVETASAQVLVVDGTTHTITAQGQRRFDHVCVINGGSITVERYDGQAKDAAGNLELLAGSVYVDASSSIDARGLGYQATQCEDGAGPNADAGGRGGCSVWDSGGGGAHFGGGGRGTVDLEGILYDPVSFEDDCDIDFNPNGPSPTPQTGPGGSCDATGVACGNQISPCPDSRGNAQGGRFCRIGESVAGDAYWHNIYDPDFGAAGGDKGCNDGDGDNNGDPIVGGHGGGRVVIAGLPHLGDGQPSPCGVGLASGEVRFDGQLDAGGTRGCGDGNDSGGGGAGGTVLIVGELVSIGQGAWLSVGGGLGGDTFAKDNDPFGDCAPGSQDPGNTCDDCGGGGGGGIISVLSVTSNIHGEATFDVSGADGGTCGLCQGEAGGGAGELQLDGAYVGEFCDGFDNDFDGSVDEGLGSFGCGYGACQATLDACTAGVPTACMPALNVDNSCFSAIDGARPRIAMVIDSSASMLLDLAGNPTFGDGSVEHPGLSTVDDPSPTDSRMFLAREAVAQVISAYPEIDFGLARYHQDQALLRSCQTATWFECQDLVASYDDPTDNTGAVACTKSWGNDIGSIDIRVEPSPGDDEECINYAGSCGPPRRGADILSGFGTEVRDMVRWLDGQETAFDADATPGDVCNHSGGGDCELRATGPTPLAGSLLAMEDYIAPIRNTDPAVACRGYSVILVTDGAESCNGDPTAAAMRLYDMFGIEVYVIAVSVLQSERASLDSIARGGSGGVRDAIPVNNAQDLVTSLTTIIAGSIRAETCNSMDDDCDGLVDEDFPGLGESCDDGLLGSCRGEGAFICNQSMDGIACDISMPGSGSEPELCNEIDDDCDGRFDEGLDCDNVVCVPAGADICNAVDDDCDDVIDEADPAEGNDCGETAGECEPGRTRCVSGMLQCVGGQQPMAEVCDGDDDDCDGEIDNEAPCPGDASCIEGACRRSCDPTDEFPCPLGFACMSGPDGEGGIGNYCLPAPCTLCLSHERCDVDTCVDRCDGVECPDGESCLSGECVDCHVAGCPDGEVCFASTCQVDACAEAECGADEVCTDGECGAVCDDEGCGREQRCGEDGSCEDDPCVAVACGSTEYCDGGECRDNPCMAMRCTPGDVCAPALGCIDDPCPLLNCPGDTVCGVTDRGTAQCATPDLGLPGGPRSGGGLAADKEREAEYVAVEGSSVLGCAVSRGSPGPAPPLWALGLALALWLRRRTR